MQSRKRKIKLWIQHHMGWMPVPSVLYPHLSDLPSGRSGRGHDVVRLHGEGDVVRLGESGLGPDLAHHLNGGRIEVVRHEHAVGFPTVSATAGSNPHDLKILTLLVEAVDISSHLG